MPRVYGWEARPVANQSWEMSCIKWVGEAFEATVATSEQHWTVTCWEGMACIDYPDIAESRQVIQPSVSIISMEVANSFSAFFNPVLLVFVLTPPSLASSFLSLLGPFLLFLPPFFLL